MSAVSYRSRYIKSTLSKTATATLNSARIYRIRWYVGPDTFNNATIKIQLEYGNTATTFQPAEEQSYEINLGKNLCTGTSVPASTQVFFNIDTNNIKSGDYVLSTSLNESTSLNTISLIIDGVATDIGTMTGAAGGVAVSKITLTDAQISAIKAASTAYIRLYKSGASFNNPTWAQLESGYINTDYSAYFTPIELCKFNTYLDYIYYSDGDWYIHKDINKVVFSGATSEGWVIYGTGADNYYYYTANDTVPNPKPTSGTTTQIVRCNYGLGGSIGTATTNVGIMITTGQKCLRVRDISEVSLDSWKAKLAADNIVLYYPIDTPTDTKITDAGLIAQLNALIAKHTLYEGVNNIFLVPSAAPDGTLTLNYIMYDKTNSHKVYIWNDAAGEWQVIVQ